MSDENQEVEQITTPPTLTAPKSKKEARPKDPKKVAAGKKLAEHNRKAKEALKREEEREKMERSAEASDAWMPEISFTTALSAVGIGLTLLDLFKRYRANAVTDKTPHAAGSGRRATQAGPLVRAERRATPTEAPHVEAPHVEAPHAERTGQIPKFGMD